MVLSFWHQQCTGYVKAMPVASVLQNHVFEENQAKVVEAMHERAIKLVGLVGLGFQIVS